MQIAAATIGHEAFEAHDGEDLRRIAPDFVLAMHPLAAKISPFPTYGCMWNPPSYFEDDPQYRQSVASYDGYFIVGDESEKWVLDIVGFLAKCENMGALLPTACEAPFVVRPALQDGSASIAYLGSNWDAERQRAFFTQMDGTGHLQVYGPAKAWTFLHSSYRGALPFDGRSVHNAIAAAGIGLCIHTDKHNADRIPTMRVFETALASAVVLADCNPFIVDAFGESVLYVDTSSNQALVADVERHLVWIRTNPEAAIEKARAAHSIALKFSLERMLEQVVAAHQARLAKAAAQSHPGVVNVILRAGKRPMSYPRRALAAIANQTHPHVKVTIVATDRADDLEAIAASEFPSLPVEVIAAGNSPYLSSHLLAGLKRVDGAYFAILDDDDVIYPEHYAQLIALVEADSRTELAYAAANKFVEKDDGSGQIVDASIAYYREFNRNALLGLDNYITSNAWLAKSSLLRKIPAVDPKFHVSEDFYLLAQFLRFTDFAFSGNVTCAFYWRESRGGNITTTASPADWKVTADRMRVRLVPAEVPFAGAPDLDHLETIAWIKRGKAIKQFRQQSPLAGRVLDFGYRGVTSLARRLTRNQTQ